MMKRSSRQFGDWFSGFGRESEKFSRISACIRRNFTPCVIVFWNLVTWKAHRTYLKSVNIVGKSLT